MSCAAGGFELLFVGGCCPGIRTLNYFSKHEQEVQRLYRSWTRCANYYAKKYLKKVFVNSGTVGSSKESSSRVSKCHPVRDKKAIQPKSTALSSGISLIKGVTKVQGRTDPPLARSPTPTCSTALPPPNQPKPTTQLAHRVAWAPCKAI